MSFDVAAGSYQRFMGRYADPLAPLLSDLAEVRPGQRVLDVGCGPGALSEVLVERLGPGSVAAIDPSEPFVAAARERLPGVDVRQGSAESLPYADGAFDAALAQLVVHFMADPVRGLAEMARVTRPGGTVAACVWDHAGGRGPLSLFWRVAREVTGAPGEGHLPGSTSGELGDLVRRAGLVDVVESELAVRVAYADFDDWWEPYTLGVGPAGDHVAGLAAEDRERLREACARVIGAGPVVTEAWAWAVRGAVAGGRGPGGRQ